MAMKYERKFELSKIVGLMPYHEWHWKINLRCSFCQSKEEYYKDNPLGNSKEVMPIWIDNGGKLVAVLICEDCFNKAKEIQYGKKIEFEKEVN